jgi:hypothetical protein
MLCNSKVLAVIMFMCNTELDLLVSLSVTTSAANLVPLHCHEYFQFSWLVANLEVRGTAMLASSRAASINTTMHLLSL